MASSGYQIAISWRVTILVILVVVLAFVLANTDWFFTPLVTAALSVVSVMELLRYLNRSHRSLNDFLLTIKQSGFNTRFPEQGPEIFRTFNEIIDEFGKLGSKNESQYQFLHTLTENIKVGLICFREDGSVAWMNPAANEYIGSPILDHLEGLRKINPELYSFIEKIPPGKNQVVKMNVGPRESEVSIHHRAVIIQKKRLDIFLFQDIQQEMDAKEVEAWQKLTRVMRHEIMNAMTPIVGLTEAVHHVLKTNRQWDSENTEEYNDVLESLEAVESQSKRLLKFVNAYKDFAQTPEVTTEAVSVKDLIGSVRSLMDQELAVKGITLEVDIKPGDLEAQLDRKLMEGVLINLVKNSIEAITGGKGTIEIVARSRPGAQFHLSVRDNGVGIAKDQLDKIFVPFYTTKEEGSGIGLSLSRQLIHLHGGNITIDSQPGHGTTFHIFL